jgi:hypothetical protein
MRDELDIAVNNVLIALEKALDHYRQAAGLSEDDAAGEEFREIARRRRRDADSVEALLRDLGYLPEEPDRDRLAVAEAATWMKARMAGQRSEALRDRAGEVDREADAALWEALGRKDLPGNGRELMKGIKERIKEDREKLASP